MGQLNWNFDLSGHVFEDSANAKHKLLQYLRSCISNQSFRSSILHRQHRLASSFRLGLSKMPDFFSFFSDTAPDSEDDGPCDLDLAVVLAPRVPGFL